jgi:predicted dehydrogenase
MQRIKIGIIGCGMVAQIMHLPHLTELSDRYEVAALCDLSPSLVQSLGERYQVERRYADYERMLDEVDLDAVLVLTLSHFEPALAALRRGKHALVEKPMCHTLREADALVDAAESQRATLMVAYMKRYDPAYRYGLARIKEMKQPRLIRVHDINGPNDWIIRDLLNVQRPADVPAEVVEAGRRAIAAKLAEAIGDAPEFVRNAYGLILGLASHDVTILRGAFGSPRRIVGTQIEANGRFVTSLLDYGDELAGVFAAGSIALKQFEEELTVWGTDRVVKISFPSPFVKNMPTLVEVREQELSEGQDPGDTPYVERRVTASYEEAFKRELYHFYDCVTTGAEPLTSGKEGREDTRLMIDIVRAGRRG